MVLKMKSQNLYVIDSESNGNYSKDEPIKFLICSIKSNLCDYSDAYILVTGNITVTRTIGLLQVLILKENNQLLQLDK